MVLQPGSLLPLSTSATSEPAQGGKQTERGNPPRPQRLTHAAFLATSAFVTFFFPPLKGLSAGISSAPRWGSLGRELGCDCTDTTTGRAAMPAGVCLC